MVVDLTYFPFSAPLLFWTFRALGSGAKTEPSKMDALCLECLTCISHEGCL